MIVARNLPPTLGDVVDELHRFRLAETEYDVATDVLKVVPSAPLPLLEVLAARRAKGYGTGQGAMTKR